MVHNVGFPVLKYHDQKYFSPFGKDLKKKGIDHEVEEVLEIDIQKEKKNVVEKKEDDISTQWCRERDDSVPEL